MKTLDTLTVRRALPAIATLAVATVCVADGRVERISLKEATLIIEYNESADHKSWDEVKKFFARLFDEKPVYIP